MTVFCRCANGSMDRCLDDTTKMSDSDSDKDYDNEDDDEW